MSYSNFQRSTLCFVLLSTVGIAAPPSTPTWTKEGLVGLTLELVDPVRYEWMTFDADGSLSISVGRQGGPIAAPVFFWTIVSGRLRIMWDDHRLYDELTLVSRDASTITARRSTGEIARYKIRPK